jgi:hypothetical protein
MSDLVSFCLMTHPRRLDGAARVIEQLDRDCEVVVDHESRGPWYGAKKGWEFLSTAGAPWCCLLQDDIDLAPGFSEQLEHLVQQHQLIGTRPLSLCNCLPERAAPGTHWVERQDGVHGPCIVLRQQDIAPMLEWVALHVQERFEFMFDDIRVSLWLESENRTSLWPDPSWVQHRGWEESLLGTRSTVRAPRTAPSYTGAPLFLTDWSLGLAPGAAVRAGLANGASRRVRNRLWRVGETRPDHERFRPVLGVV